MTAHDHSTFVEGCYRCDLSRDEVEESMSADIEQPDLRSITINGEHHSFRPSELGYVLLEMYDRERQRAIRMAGFAVANDGEAYRRRDAALAERDAAVQRAERFEAEVERLRAIIGRGGLQILDDRDEAYVEIHRLQAAIREALAGRHTTETRRILSAALDTEKGDGDVDLDV